MEPFICCLGGNEALQGIAVDRIANFSDVIDPETGAQAKQVSVLIGVLWNDHRSPAPSYHEPKELTFMQLLDDAEAEEADEAEEEETEEEEDVEQTPTAEEQFDPSETPEAGV